jgi:hypothetical protein
MKLYIHGAVQHPTRQRLVTILNSAGFNLVTSEDDFDFVLPVFDPVTAGAAQIAVEKSKYFPDASFTNKLYLEGRCVAAGVPTLPATELSAATITQCDYPHFIIKPKIWSGGKHPFPWVYKIFSQSEKQQVIDLIGSYPNIENFVIQKALIDPVTNETPMLFVDGVVNGNGQIHFNSISIKAMKNPNSLDSYITYKSGVRLVSAEDKYGFKAKITTLLQANNTRNTLFKVQAIVDEVGNTCYINDWSWTISPYVQLYILDPSYIQSHLQFAYDLAPTVTKPIDKPIVLNHVEFPRAEYTTDTVLFDNKYKAIADQFEVIRVESLVKDMTNNVTPVTSNFYVLYGIACDDVEVGKQKMADFQAEVLQ